MQVDKKIENFLADSVDFIEEFESKFVDYFTSLCSSYDTSYSKEMIENVAYLVYKDVFTLDVFIAHTEKEVLSEMLDDDVIMLRFLINRSMFFLLENYTKDENENSYKHIQTLVLCITEYISEFERKIINNNQPQSLHFNFDTQENFLAGNNILEIFRKIRENGETVTFFNLYKGIPIKHSGVIVDIDGENVAFKTIQTQEIAMNIDGKAYILVDSNFDKPIKADIVSSNFASSTVVLNNFIYLLNMPATKREFVRVHPDIMAEVTLSSEKNLVTTGKLFDLSVSGLGVISAENNGIYAGAKIELKFVLSIGNDQKPNTIQVEGEVLNIIEYSSSYRYCIKIYPKADMEEKIVNYVSQREVEILDNLEKEADSYKM